MSFDFSSHVQGLSVFENYLKSGSVVTAVKENTIVFTAMSNVIKASPISSDTKAYKIIKLLGDEFDVKDLVFCPTERYLAVVGENKVEVVDTNGVRFSDRSNAVVRPFSFETNLTRDEIRTIVWHPASARKEIVVLTLTQILVYDILLMFSGPVLTLELSAFPELDSKKVCSIAFGSSHNLAGSITLYLTTENGHIYAVYPFLYEGSHFKATTTQLSLLHHESEEALTALGDKFPPIVTNGDPTVAALSRQISFIHSLQDTLALKVAKELEGAGEVILTYSGAEFGYKLQSVGETAPNSTLVQISSNDDFSLLASVSSATGKTTVEYLGQFQPAIMGWTKKAQEIEKPTKPAPVTAKAKKERYVKPARGFGYVIESSSDEEDDSSFEAEIKAYDAKVEIYNLQKQLHAHCNESFGSLTKMAADKFDGKNPITCATNDHKLLLALEGTLYSGDLKRATDSLSLSTPSAYAPSFEKSSISPKTTTMAYCQDLVNHSGTYAITCSPSDKVGVTRIVDNDVKPAPSPVETIELLPAPKVSTIPVEELLVGVNRDFTIEKVKNFEPESAKSLQDVHTTTQSVASQISSLTKFLVALQIKLKFQMEDINAQVADFEKVSRAGSKAEVDVRANEKLERLLQRQQELSQKQKRLHKRVLDRFEHLKLKIDLPLSDAEIQWYKELNVINKTLSTGNEGEEGVIDDVDQITKQVEQLKTNDDGGDLAQKLLEMGPELSRIHHFLVGEAAVISRARAKAQAMAATASQV